MSTPAFNEAYRKLNIKQKEAVDTTEGPLMVVAGPGTGKTELLALRVANIIYQTESGASNILCLTFTDNGAINMRERLIRYIGQDAHRVGIYTFHAFCNSIIGNYPEYFYQAANFTNASDQDKNRIINDIFKRLPHGHPLASYHPKEGFVFLNDVLRRIHDIKCAGLTPEAYQNKITESEKDHAAINKVLKSWPPGRNSIKRLNEFRVLADELASLKTSTGSFLASSLRQAIAQADNISKTTPIGDWKKKYTKSDEEEIIYTDSHRLEKIKAVAEIYRVYSQELHSSALYDYDDMIIDVSKALSENNILRKELAEQYQYILIDEFQDTNQAQMGLVLALTKSSSNQVQPNIMVVGDDDQAIYRFQGAEISNIIDFRKDNYQSVKTIVLDTNYRSHQEILDFSRKIVLKGQNRLENKFADINKTLTQGNKEIQQSNIQVKNYQSDAEEYSAVARQIKTEIENGRKPEQIAVLGRNHRELKNLLPFLDAQKIPYEYTKKSSVFDQPHIREIIMIMEYISSINANTNTKEEHLPTILSFPYFNISRSTLLELAVQAKKNYTPWTELISSYDQPEIKAVYALLNNLIAQAEVQPLEHLIDLFIQSSGFRGYYFNEQILNETPSIYIHFLSALKTFIEALRQWRQNEILYAKDIAPFVALHEERNISLISESPLIKAANTVQIMTVHSAKGLEFESVYLIATHDKIWTRGSRGSKAPIPLELENLLNSAGDCEDDFIRLFYVATTRAKHTLHISGHDLLLRYLDEQPESEVTAEGIDISAYENSLNILMPPYSQDELRILKTLVSNYRMPITHMQNFLNVKEGGPAYFIEQNLLRFPQAMSDRAAYGSAIHKALETFVIYPKQNSSTPAPLELILSTFQRTLRRARLQPQEQQRQEARGLKLLTVFHHKLSSFFKADDQVEVDMKAEGISINGTLLTGKLDFLRTENGSYQVIDFKTGKTCRDWEVKNAEDYEKIKLHKYRQQLVFYKLLLENSIHYQKPISSLSLQFVESILEENTPVSLTFMPSAEEVDRLKKLAQIVYNCIINLEFPDISKYEKNYSGVLKFEEDLLNRS